MDEVWFHVSEGNIKSSDEEPAGLDELSDLSEPDSIEFNVESLEELSEESVHDVSWADGLVGETFGGRFLIEKEIARGGMGVVFLGRQTNLNRTVVVKVLSKYFVDGPEDLARFELEAMGLSALQHPNIVTIYDHGAQDGLSYIAMEYIEGETLEQRLARRTVLSMAEFVRIVPQLLRAIGTAHEQGIIHRDIKPANVMMTRRNGQDDFVKVVDFGLVKLLGSGREITGKGLVGTFGYVSPEQILGNPYDARSDVYSLGVLMYHMLAGRKPFDDPDGMAVLYKHVHETPPDLGSLAPGDEPIPAALVKLIHQCMEKDPARRPRDANEVLDLMVKRGLVADSDISGPRGTSEYDRAALLSALSLEVPRRSRVIQLLTIGCVAIAATALAVSLVESRTRIEAPALASAGADGKDDQRVSGFLDEAERLADARKWTEASILLRRADATPSGDPALLSRSVQLENRIVVGQLLTEAELHVESGRPDMAMRRLEEVLRRDPRNARADETLTELRGQIAATDEAKPSPPLDEAPVEAPVEEVVLAEAVKPREKTEAPKKPAAANKKTQKAEKKPIADKPQKSEKVASTKSGSVASPRLPSQLRVQNRRVLEQMLRRVEGEAIDRNSFRALDVQNSTRLLFKAAAADLEAAREPTVSPRKIYYLIANGVKAGKKRDTIASELEKAYRAGKLL